MLRLGRSLVDVGFCGGGFMIGVLSAHRRPKRHGPPTTITEALARAEKKLRQAEFFLGPFASQPGQAEEAPEFYFSACLSAVRSAFYILLDQDESAFQRDQQKWGKTRSRDDREFFKHMRQRRDDDVHRGVVDATTLPKFVDATRGWPARFRYLFNAEGDAQVKMENPDRSTTRAPTLATEPTLYIDYKGGRLEAVKACQMFIELMRDLVGHVRARRGP